MPRQSVHRSFTARKEEALRTQAFTYSCAHTMYQRLQLQDECKLNYHFSLSWPHHGLATANFPVRFDEIEFIALNTAKLRLNIESPARWQ